MLVRRCLKGFFLIFIPVGILIISGQCAYATTTELISVTRDGEQGIGRNFLPSVSADGRYVAFFSYDRTWSFVPDDTNGFSDIFVADRATGVIERVSVGAGNLQGNGHSYAPSISGDGRYVAFVSYANNLVANDSNNFPDVFVHDRNTGETTLVSVANDGTQGNNRALYGLAPSISSNGRVVAFVSMANNLASDDTNGVADVFVRDMDSNITERVSLNSDGTEFNGPITDSIYTNISSNGRYVAFSFYSYDGINVFVRDRESGITQCVSISSDGTRGNGLSIAPSISYDGRYVAFESFASNFVSGDTFRTRDVFVHDRITGKTEIVSLSKDGLFGNDDSWGASISGDGRFVAFVSRATNLVPEKAYDGFDIFLRDREAGTTELLSINMDGRQGNGDSKSPFISSDGQVVVFPSRASDLVPEDRNGHGTDIFARVFAEKLSPAELVDNLSGIIQGISPEAFQNPADQRISSLENKLQDILAQLNTIDETTTADEKYAVYSVVLDKLNNDVLAKTDGFHGGNPNNDWIVTQAGQDLLYPKIANVIEAIEAELAKL